MVVLLRLLTCISVGLLSCILVALKDDFDKKLSVFINILLKEKFWNRALDGQAPDLNPFLYSFADQFINL